MNTINKFSVHSLLQDKDTPPLQQFHNPMHRTNSSQRGKHPPQNRLNKLCSIKQNNHHTSCSTSNRRRHQWILVSLLYSKKPHHGIMKSITNQYITRIHQRGGNVHRKIDSKLAQHALLDQVCGNHNRGKERGHPGRREGGEPLMLLCWVNITGLA